MNFHDLISGRQGNLPPLFLDQRFDAAGSALRCAGNTVVTHVSNAALNTAIDALAHRLSTGPAGNSFAWLPASSYHMTLFNGLLYDERDTLHWPATLPTDASEDDADQFMQDRIAAVPAPAGPYRMKLTGFSGVKSHALGLSLEAQDQAEDLRLRDWRDQLATATDLTRRPGHALYRFHITLAYMISWPNQDQAAAFDLELKNGLAALAQAFPVLELGPAQFCTFDDMTHFEVVRELA